MFLGHKKGCARIVASLNSDNLKLKLVSIALMHLLHSSILYDILFLFLPVNYYHLLVNPSEQVYGASSDESKEYAELTAT